MMNNKPIIESTFAIAEGGTFMYSVTSRNCRYFGSCIGFFTDKQIPWYGIGYADNIIIYEKWGVLWW